MEIEPQQIIDYPSAPAASEPAPAKAWRPVLLMAGIGLVLALLAAGGYFYWQSRTASQIERARADLARQQALEAADNCTQSSNPEACRELSLTRSALLHGRADLCGLLSGREYADCLFALANERQDAEICALLPDSSAVLLCADNIYLRQAAEQNSLAWCERIVEPEKRDNCRFSVSWRLTPKQCQESSLGQEFCADLALIETARQAQDPDLCNALFSPMAQAVCLSSVYPDPDFDGLENARERELGTDPRQADTDRDGLSDYEEVMIYGTDPLNPDTDGDGFSDGEEVGGGYNPLGHGRL